MIFNEVIKKAGGGGQTYVEEPNAAGGMTAIITGGLELSPNGIYNKAAYGNNTLIDLSGDAITPIDVIHGITFHLSNGEQGTGAFTGIYESSAERESSLAISFNVDFEPTCLFCLNASRISAASGIVAVGFWGNLSFWIYASYSSSTTTFIYDDANNPITWAFSNGVVTLTKSGYTSPYFTTDTHHLYYM